MSQLGTVYATKRRRRNGKSLKPPPKDGVTKSNPSKRHRERLNAELDLLASLLPFEQNILSKLDRLSILRLSVSYLRTKSYFQVVMHKDKEENGILPHIHAHDGYRTRELGAFEHGLLDGDMFLQALNGFLMILTCDGEVFFATHSIESYLGFHQSDIVHQSVYELVHSEDREELQRQLLWNSFLPSDMSSMQLAETLAPDKALHLERSFTVRFRCLLDNTSGFLRLDIRGRIKVLHGQNRKTEEPPLALFAYCTPFGPPSLLEIPHKENMFKSKHKLDFSLVSMDQRGKHILGYSDTELASMGGYDLVHFDDLAYVASAHQELLKTGASGMIAYRYQKKDGEWQWLQTSSRLVYKNSKPDFVICTHRQLMDEEGHDLLGKRTMDFKVSYLDTGLASTYFSEADQLVVPPSGSPNSLPPPVTPTRPNRRYKTQLRDFLSTCRSKRKMQQQQPPQQSSPLGQVTSPAPVVEYLPDPAVAVAAAYSNLNPMYTASPYATAADNLYMGTSVHSTNFYPVTENLFHQYRLQGVGGYYTDYHHSGAPASAYVANGFLPYDGYAIAAKDEKWQETGKYYSGYSSGYGSPTSTTHQVSLKTPKSSPHVMEVVSCSSDGPSPVGPPSGHAASGGASAVNSTAATNGSVVVSPKVELAGQHHQQQQHQQQQQSQEHFERQTVLMWGTQSSGIPISAINRHQGAAAVAGERSPQSTPLTNGLAYNGTGDAEGPAAGTPAAAAKWNGTAKEMVKGAPNTPDSYQMQHDDSGLYSSSSHTTSPQQQQQHQRLPSGANNGSSAGSGAVNSSSSTNSVAEQQQQQHNNSSTTHTRRHPTSHQPQPHPHQHPTHNDTVAHPTHTLHHLASNGTAESAVPTASPLGHHTYSHASGGHQQQHPHHPHHHAHSPHAAGGHHATAAAASHLTHHPHAHHAHAQSHHTHLNPHAHAHAHQQGGVSSSTATGTGTTPSVLNGSEIILNQQQQLGGYSSNQLQPLNGCASTTSSSSSPSCTSPTAVGGHQQQHQRLPPIGILNGANSNGTLDVSPYHQLAIIASPIVLASDNDLSHAGVIDVSGSTATYRNANRMTGPTTMSGANLMHHPLLQASSNVGGATTTIANITAHTSLAYAPNGTYLIGPGTNAVSLGGDQQPDGSPLLSFSEVTNTLLNQ